MVSRIPGRFSTAAIRWYGLATVTIASIVIAGGIFRRMWSPELGVVSNPTMARETDLETSVPNQPPTLPETDRRDLWEIENRAFQLTYKFAPQFCRAVADQDRTTLRQWLQREFTGQVFDPYSAETIQRPYLTARFQRTGTHGSIQVGGEEFLNLICDYVRRFADRPHVELFIVRLAPAERHAFSGPWRSAWTVRLCGLAASSASNSLGVGGVRAEGPDHAYWKRIRLDGGRPREIVLSGQVELEPPGRESGDLTGLVRGWSIEQATQLEADHVLFEDITAQTGIAVEQLHDNWTVSPGRRATVPGEVHAGDVNGDGRTDLLILDQGPPTPYVSVGPGRFANRSLELGVPWDRQSASALTAIADLDNDGDSDLIVGGLVLEQRDARFLRRSRLSSAGRPSGIAVADFDRDGWVDLYVSHAAASPTAGSDRASWINDQSGFPNVLYRNLGGFRFEDVTERTGAGAGRRSTFTSVWLDSNDDGWPDLYVINELGPNVLLVNRRDGTFREVHVGPRWDGFAMGVDVGDVDNDGRIDIYVANMKSKIGQRVVNNLPSGVYPSDVHEQFRRWVGGNMLLLNRGGEQYEESLADVSGGGWSYGCALVDLDADGLLDIYSTCGFTSVARDKPDG